MVLPVALVSQAMVLLLDPQHTDILPQVERLLQMAVLEEMDLDIQHLVDLEVEVLLVMPVEAVAVDILEVEVLGGMHVHVWIHKEVEEVDPLMADPNKAM
jgi:hypothetical protein